MDKKFYIGLFSIKSRFILISFSYNNFFFAGCEPTRIWMVVRHGTRYPGVKKIKKMQSVLVNLRDEIILNANNGSLCSDEIEAFKNWQLTAHISDDKNLAHEGEDEMIDLAERMQQRFSNLFPEEYSNLTYQVSHEIFY